MLKILFLLLVLLFPNHQAKEKYAPETWPSKDELLGKIDPSTHPDFTRIDPAIGYFPEMYLRKDTYQAFLDMRKAARNDGINLTLNLQCERFTFSGICGIRNFQVSAQPAVPGLTKICLTV